MFIQHINFLIKNINVRLQIFFYLLFVNFNLDIMLLYNNIQRINKIVKSFCQILLN